MLHESPCFLDFILIPLFAQRAMFSSPAVQDMALHLHQAMGSEVGWFGRLDMTNPLLPWYIYSTVY